MNYRDRNYERITNSGEMEGERERERVVYEKWDVNFAVDTHLLG